MRLAKILTLVVVTALPALAAWPAEAASERGPRYASPSAPQEDPNGARVIVKYRALGTLMRARAAARAGARGGPQMAAQLAQRNGIRLSDGHIVNGHTQVVFGDKTMTSVALAAKLAADPEVEYAVPDLRRHAFAAPNDPLYASWPASVTPLPAVDVALAVGQWYLRPVTSTFISAINAEGAWALTTGSANIVVADIDTGVLFGHPDLTSKLLAGRNFFSTNGTIGDGWSADASDPGDWTTRNECGQGQPSTPSSWHGTQTASIIGAATNNGSGMASVGYNVMVQPVRVLGKCGGFDSDIIAGMYWAGGLADPATGDPAVPANPTPAKVINMSLGGNGSCPQAYVDAVAALNAAGVTVVVAAGNDEGTPVGTPGNCPGVIAVAGLRNVGTKVGFSSIGPEVAISAPAGNCVNTTGACLYPILTATNTGTTTPNSAGYTYSDSTNYSVGTSFSTPMVTGTVALMLSINPSLTPSQILAMLQSSARTFPTTSAGATSAVPACTVPTATSAVQDECICTTSTCGAGMLDARGAVAAAAATAAPTVSVTASAATVTDGTTVTFNSSATTATGRTIASYSWTLSAGSTIATLSGGSSGPSATVLTHGVGSFTVQLTVTDSSGATASASSTVTVNAPAAPTVNILASTSVVTAGNSVTFDGGSSSVPAPVTITGYQWTISAGTNLASFSSATNAATATAITGGSGSGTFTVQLTVTDSLGRQASSTKTVSIVAAALTASISASATSVTVGSSVTFDGSSSIAPSGRTIAGYQWSIISGSGIAAISGSATGSTVSVATSAAGTFTVQLTVTDSLGSTNSQTSSVTVNAITTTGNPPPSSSGGGGGTTSPAWLAALALAVAALARTRREGPT